MKKEEEEKSMSMGVVVEEGEEEKLGRRVPAQGCCGGTVLV